MQQTNKYKLNLIEKDDVFSPDPLNENMEKVEAAISAEAAALDQRILTLEGHPVAAGYSTTVGTVELGFTPIAVVLQFFSHNSTPVVSLPERPIGIAFEEGGFTYTSSHTGCGYIAFG